MSTCAACGLAPIEATVPFCLNHWGQLPTDLQALFHDQGDHEADIARALVLIERHEAEQAKHPTRLIGRRA